MFSACGNDNTRHLADDYVQTKTMWNQDLFANSDLYIMALIQHLVNILISCRIIVLHLGVSVCSSHLQFQQVFAWCYVQKYHCYKNNHQHPPQLVVSVHSFFLLLFFVL